MKLYKGDRIMQSVDKDQLQDCIDAGWSRTEPVAEEVEIEKDSEKEETASEEKPKTRTVIKPIKKKK